MTNEARTVLLRRRPGAVDRFLLQKLSGKRDRSRIEEDLEEGRLERLDVEADWVASGEEIGGEGPIVFVGSGDVVLILVGQWLYDPQVVRRDVPEGGFFKSFTLQRAPKSGVPLSLDATSHATLSYVRTISGDVLGNLMQMPGTGDTAVVRARDLAELERVLRGGRISFGFGEDSVESA